MAKNLKPIQYQAIALMVQRDFNGMTLKSIAEELGINESTLYRWKEKPLFIEELNKQAELVQRAFLSDAYSRLRGYITNPQTNERTVIKALELYFKNQGKLKNVEEQTVEVKDVNADDILKSLGL